MKRLCAILMALVLGISCIGAVSAAETDSQADAQQAEDAQISEDLREAMALLDILADGTLFTEDTVSRGVFVQKLTQLLQIPDAVPAEYFFSDVKSFSEFAGSVYAAYEQGWISRDENFEPQRQITVPEALKILVRAMGYGLLSDSKGGFPAGDLYVANLLDLLDGVDAGADGLNKEAAYQLLSNALRAPILQQLVFGATEEYKRTGETLLSQVYHIYELEGIVSRTPYNALDGQEVQGKGGTLDLDGEAFTCEEAPYDLLGTRCRVYVRRDEAAGEQTVVFLRDLSEQRTFRLQDLIQKDDRRLQYWNADGSQERNVTLAANCEVIYNGRKLAEGIEEAFKPGAGSVLLKDNEGDGAYDVVFVNRYSYIETLDYDNVGNILRDKNGAEYSIQLDQVVYEFRDESGATMDVYDISQGDLFQVIRSKDGGFLQASRQTEAVTGMVTRIEDSSLYIDNTEYDISDYFKELFLSRVQAGQTGSFYVTSDRVLISSAMADSGMRYGYLTGAAWEGAFRDTLLLRIFTQDDSMEVYPVRDKVTLDGERSSDPQAVYSALADASGAVMQLIRFEVNGDGKIITLDTASDTLPEKPGVYPNDQDRLTRYTFPTADVLYKNIGTFAAYCDISSAVVFSIPTDTSEEKDFAAQGKAAFQHDRRYTVEVFDLDQMGAAGAVVYKNTNPNDVGVEQTVMVIQDIGRSVNENGEEGYIVNGWSGGSFVSRFIEEDIQISKLAESGTPVDSMHPVLSGGDIVRCETNADGTIRAIVVDFDARQGVFAPNNTSFNLDTNRSPMFFEGMVYAVGGSLAAISSKRLPDGSYDFTQPNLRYVSTNTNNIVLYDAENGEVRPISASEIKNWSNDGGAAYYAVFCQNNFVTKTVVLYDRMEGRR